MEKKSWSKSRTVWGVALFAISTFAPKYQPIAEMLPTVADEIGQIAGSLLALYGRRKAAGPITAPWE